MLIENTPCYLYTAICWALSYNLPRNFEIIPFLQSSQDTAITSRNRSSGIALLLVDTFCFLRGHLRATCRQSGQKQCLPEVLALWTYISMKLKPRAKDEIEWIFALITVKTSKSLESSWDPSIYLAVYSEEWNVVSHKWEENELSETVPVRREWFDRLTLKWPTTTSSNVEPIWEVHLNDSTVHREPL